MAQNDNEIMRRRFDLDWQRIHLVRLFLKKTHSVSCASPSRLHVPKKSDKKPTPARMQASRISIHSCELSADDGSRAQEHPDFASQILERRGSGTHSISSELD